MGKTLMDGTEQTLFEYTKLGEYSGFVFLDKMESGDTIAVKIYIMDVEDETYKLWISETFSGALTIPAIRVVPVIGKVGFKVTAQQTAGTYREITHMWFKR